MSIEILMFLIVLFFVSGIALALNKGGKIAKVLSTICIVPVVCVAVLFGAFLLGFGTGDFDFYFTLFSIFGAFVAIALGCAIWKVWNKKYIKIPVIVGMVACVLTFIGFNAHKTYVDSIPVVAESNNILDKYAPYADNSVVATLDEESNLLITSDLPKMDGATALYPVYSAFAKAVYPKDLIDGVDDEGHYELDNEYLQCNTTTEAYNRMVTGEADIIFAAPPSEEQKQYAIDNGVELTYTPIGKEAFVFFVNSKNPINDITLEQIRAIYSGEITEWSELGVKRLGDIRAFQRDEGSGSQSTLISIMDGKSLIVPLKKDVIDGMGGIIEKTADYKNYRNAIGYSFRFYSTEMVKNDEIKLLSINGVEPTVENIENGKYPLASEFLAVTRSDASENTKKLVEWILSEQGQKLIELTGYTPLK